MCVCLCLPLTRPGVQDLDRLEHAIRDGLQDVSATVSRKALKADVQELRAEVRCLVCAARKRLALVCVRGTGEGGVWV
jgi:hypothetical protein